MIRDFRRGAERADILIEMKPPAGSLHSARSAYAC